MVLSRKSSLKTPGRHSERKSVRFADWNGESLTAVRHLDSVEISGKDAVPSTSDDEDIRVRLCSFNSNGLFVGGTIHTVNPRYRDRSTEEVYILVSTDNWRTSQKINSFRFDSLPGGLMSRWCFSGHLKDLGQWTQCCFKVVYVYNGGVVEDNNHGKCYRLQLELRKQNVQKLHDSIISDLLTFEQLLIY